MFISLTIEFLNIILSHLLRHEKVLSLRDNLCLIILIPNAVIITLAAEIPILVNFTRQIYIFVYLTYKFICILLSHLSKYNNCFALS